MAQYGDDYTICPICGFKEGTLPTDLRCMEPGYVLGERYIVGMPMSVDGWMIKYIGWDALTNRKAVINEFFPTRYAAREVGAVPLTVVKPKPFYKYMAVLLKKAQLLSEMHLPDNVCTVYESFEKNNTAYVITEYVEGKPLGEYIKEKSPMEMKSVEKMMLPVLKSLDKLHENGFISGGFSPANFLVTDENDLIFNDYITNIFYNIVENGSERKAAESDKYYPRERISVSETIDLSPENDVYSAAMIMYEMLGAKLPDCQKRSDSFEQKHKDILKKPSSCGAKLEKSKENAIINAGTVSMSDRTPDMETFIKELTSGKDVKLRSEGKSKFPLWAKIAIPAAAVLAVGAAILVPVMLNNNSKQSAVETLAEGQTVVPSIVNYNLKSASEELESRKLLIEIEGKEVNDDKDEDTVVSQSVQKGTMVSENTVVGVTVSAKSGEFTMPNFLGIDERSCTEVLENIGVNYAITMEHNSNISQGCVVSQSISPYSKVTAGQRVDIVVSDGPEPDAKQPEGEAVVKELVDQPYESIVSSNSDDNIPVEVVERVYDSSKPEGTVVQQYPPAGTVVEGSSSADANEAVKIVVTTSNENVIIPDVTYLDRERAQKLLAYFGLKSEFSEEVSDTVADGLVFSQQPSPGQPGVIGDLVKVTVSKGKQKVSMPDTVGKTKEEAQKTLKDAGLAYTTTYDSDPAKSDNEVTRQNITPSTQVSKGTNVVLTVNTGSGTVKIPDIVGMSVNDADKIIVDAGLNLVIYADEEHPYTEGIVAAQGPKPGLYTEKGNDVFVILSAANEPVVKEPSLDISAKTVSLDVDEEFILNIELSNVQDLSSVEYDVTDTSVVDVKYIDKDTLAMTFKAFKPGSADITISCGELSKVCRVIVAGGEEPKKSELPSLPEINISPESAALKVDETFVLSIELKNIEDISAVEYDITDPSIVDVTHIDRDTLAMTFKGLAPGSTDIIISCGELSKACKVTVS